MNADYLNRDQFNCSFKRSNAEDVIFYLPFKNI